MRWGGWRHGTREVLVLRYVAELSVAEVAAQVRLPAGTVKRRLHRARRALAGQVGDEREGWPRGEDRLREELVRYATDGGSGRPRRRWR